jgi:hypothetical protein
MWVECDGMAKLVEGSDGAVSGAVGVAPEVMVGAEVVVGGVYGQDVQGGVMIVCSIATRALSLPMRPARSR